MVKKPLFILFLIPALLVAEDQTHLGSYIAEGLKNNLALRQQEFSLEKSLQALKEARGMFFPAVSFQARYSRAGGGRMIEFPVGDMLNPIYGSLNDLYQFHGIDTTFPTNISNLTFPFLREQEQDTKIRIVQPLFQRSLYQNIKLKSSLNLAQRAQLDTFKRQLISEIQTAYYNYAKTLSLDRLLEQTRQLLEENLRVSQKLLDNGKATEDSVFRAEAELAGFDQKKAESEKDKILAAAFFNFLLNRNLDDPILLDDMAPPSFPEDTDIDKAVSRAIKNRHELQQLEFALSAASRLVTLAGAASFPSLFAVIDYGIQGETYRFGRDDDYWIASLNLEWNVFSGSQNLAKKNQAILDRKKLEAQRQEMEKQIAIQVHEAYLSYRTAGEAVKAAEKREESAKKSFAIVSRMYASGMVPQITLLDARSALTGASVNHISALYELHIEKARFEQVSALFDPNIYQRKQGVDDDQ